MIKRIISAGVLCCLAALTGCGSQKTTVPNTVQNGTIAKTTAVSESSAEDVTESETEAVTDPEISPYRNPLTGELGYAESAVGKRPVAVMVNNLKGALPQYGIAEADIIYELPVEGGITRLMAVYANYADVPEVCSVRSCRYYYPILCLGMDAIYCHWGLDQTIAKETLERTGIDHLDGGQYYGSLYFRDSERERTYAQEHTGYLDGPKLPEVLENQGIRTELLDDYDQPLFNFASEDEKITPQGETAQEVTMNFSGSYYSTFQYDETSGEYKKLHSGEPHMDQRTGTQLSFENVLILQTLVYPRENNYLMDVELSGGMGYYVSNGSIEQLTWEKSSETAPIKLYDFSGSELTLNCGKTYIGIIGSDKQISYS